MFITNKLKTVVCLDNKMQFRLPNEKKWRLNAYKVYPKQVKLKWQHCWMILFSRYSIKGENIEIVKFKKQPKAELLRKGEYGKHREFWGQWKQLFWQLQIVVIFVIPYNICNIKSLSYIKYCVVEMMIC